MDSGGPGGRCPCTLIYTVAICFPVFCFSLFRTQANLPSKQTSRQTCLLNCTQTELQSHFPGKARHISNVTIIPTGPAKHELNKSSSKGQANVQHS
jgi:hypothetical protein